MSPQDTVALKMKRPCKTCPFRRNTSMILNPGRLRGIADHILTDDHATFVCHGTVDYNDESRHGETADGQPSYDMGRDSQQCAGASIFLLKHGQPNVRMRLAQGMGVFTPDGLLAHADEVIDDPAENEPAADGRRE